MLNFLNSYIVDIIKYMKVPLIVGLLLSGIGFFVSYFVSQGKIKIGSWEPFSKKKEN